MLRSGLFLLVTSFAFGQNFTDKNFAKKVRSMTKSFDTNTLYINTFKKMLSSNKDLIILDAREKDEYEVSKIPGAIHVGYEDFDIAKLSSLLNKEKRVVIYCSVGYRSGEIAEKISEKGYKAYNLLGGIFEWVNQGNEVVDIENKKTQKVHTYNKEWSIWLQKGQKVYKR